MLLTGTYHRALDEKLRFAIPKPLRDALTQSENTVLYVAPGTDGSLALYTDTALSAMATQLGQGSPNSQDVRAFGRLFYAQAQPAEMDRQGRIRVPTELAQLVGLGREIVLLGVCDHLEIWDRGRWDAYLASKQPQYDSIAENAFGNPTTATPQESPRPTAPAGTDPRPPQPR
jgi:MraZ protein